MKDLKDYVRSIPDFPEKGIIFRDVTSVLQDAKGLRASVDAIQECLGGRTGVPRFYLWGAGGI